MAAPHHIAWLVLLAGSVLLCAQLGRASMLGSEQRLPIVAGGLVAIACAAVAAIHAPGGW